MCSRCLTHSGHVKKKTTQRDSQIFGVHNFLRTYLQVVLKSGMARTKESEAAKRHARDLSTSPAQNLFTVPAAAIFMGPLHFTLYISQ